MREKNNPPSVFWLLFFLAFSEWTVSGLESTSSTSLNREEAEFIGQLQIAQRLSELIGREEHEEAIHVAFDILDQHVMTFHRNLATISVHISLWMQRFDPPKIGQPASLMDQKLVHLVRELYHCNFCYQEKSLPPIGKFTRSSQRIEKTRSNVGTSIFDITSDGSFLVGNLSPPKIHTLSLLYDMSAPTMASMSRKVDGKWIELLLSLYPDDASLKMRKFQLDLLDHKHDLCETEVFQSTIQSGFDLVDALRSQFLQEFEAVSSHSEGRLEAELDPISKMVRPKKEEWSLFHLSEGAKKVGMMMLSSSIYCQMVDFARLFDELYLRLRPVIDKAKELLIFRVRAAQVQMGKIDLLMQIKKEEPHRLLPHGFPAICPAEMATEDSSAFYHSHIDLLLQLVQFNRARLNDTITPPIFVQNNVESSYLQGILAMIEVDVPDNVPKSANSLQVITETFLSIESLRGMLSSEPSKMNPTLSLSSSLDFSPFLLKYIWMLVSFGLQSTQTTRLHAGQLQGFYDSSGRQQVWNASDRSVEQSFLVAVRREARLVEKVQMMVWKMELTNWLQYDSTIKMSRDFGLLEEDQFKQLEAELKALFPKSCSTRRRLKIIRLSETSKRLLDDGSTQTVCIKDQVQAQKLLFDPELLEKKAREWQVGSVDQLVNRHSGIAQRFGDKDRPHYLVLPVLSESQRVSGDDDDDAKERLRPLAFASRSHILSNFSHQLVDSLMVEHKERLERALKFQQSTELLSTKTNQPEFFEKDSFLFKFPQAIIRWNHAIITTPCTAWLQSVQMTVSPPKFFSKGTEFTMRLIDQIIDLSPGLQLRKAFLLNSITENYYHFLIEDMSRLMLAMAAGVFALEPSDEEIIQQSDVAASLRHAPPQIITDNTVPINSQRSYFVESDDVVLIIPDSSSPSSTFARQLLHLIDFPENRVLWYPTSHQVEMHVDQLYTVQWEWPNQPSSHTEDNEQPPPPLPRFPPYVHNTLSHYLPPRLGLHLLREKILPKLNGESRNLVVFSVRESHIRRGMLVDFDPLKMMVSCIIEQINQERQQEKRLPIELVFHFGNESVVDQAEMFYRAVVVSGAHGAGMSNIVFCRKGTVVLELPQHSWVDHSFAHISSVVDLDYRVIPELVVGQGGKYMLNSPYLMNLLGVHLSHAIHDAVGIEFSYQSVSICLIDG